MCSARVDTREWSPAAWRNLGLDKTRARFEGGPLVRMMQADVPGARAAHRKSTQYDTIRVDVVALPHGFQSLEDVRLAGPAIGVIGATKYLQDDVLLVGGKRLRRIVAEEKATSFICAARPCSTTSSRVGFAGS